MIRRLFNKLINVNFFYHEFIIVGYGYSFINKIKNNLTGALINNPKTNKCSEDIYKNKIQYINYVPFYLDINFKPEYAKVSFNKFTGYAINFEGVTSLNDYLLKQFKPKNRTRVRARIKRLETCFNITYKLHHGAIDKDHYNFLIDKLIAFIERRFTQRGDNPEWLSNIERIRDNTYTRLLDKSASLFVIYNNDDPINISLNFHCDNVIIGYYRSYDVDYSKFRMGYVDTAKQVECCINLQIQYLDLGHGYLLYKEEWSNYLYTNKNYIAFNKRKLVPLLLGYPIAWLYKYSNKYLGEKKKIFDSSAEKKVNVYGEYVIKPLSKDINIDNYSLVNYNSLKRLELRKPLFDFLYDSKQHIDSIKILKSKHQKNNSYIIKGLKKAVEITLLD